MDLIKFYVKKVPATKKGEAMYKLLKYAIELKWLKC